MEGKNLSFLAKPMFWGVFVLLILLGGGFFAVKNGYLDTIKEKFYNSEKIVVQRKDKESVILKNYKEKYSVVIPSLFTTQTSRDRLNFFTSDLRCKLSFEEIKKQNSLSIEDWIENVKISNVDSTTIISEELRYLDSENKTAIYTVDTAEVGFSKIYYMDRGQKLIQIVIYADDKNSSCYNEINNIYIK